MKVIGIDGGGTKTTAVLASDTEILKKIDGGPSSPRNIGVDKAASTLIDLLDQLYSKDVDHTLIGLPAVYEQPHYGKEIKAKIISKIPSNLTITNDQIVAFRSGTQQKDGVLIISGTGTVAHGWWENKQAHASGWGWLADEGSAFWIGQKALQATFKDIDHRGRPTKIKDIALSQLGIKEDELIRYLYKNPKKVTAQFSIFCDEASQRKDPIAQKIMVQAARELHISFRTVVKKLDLQDKEFPLVLVGGSFKSPLLLERLKESILETTPQANIIRPDNDPVLGAVRLALEK